VGEPFAGDGNQLVKARPLGWVCDHDGFDPLWQLGEHWLEQTARTIESGQQDQLHSLAHQFIATLWHVGLERLPRARELAHPPGDESPSPKLMRPKRPSIVRHAASPADESQP
jgi:hypothetical protein